MTHPTPGIVNHPFKSWMRERCGMGDEGRYPFKMVAEWVGVSFRTVTRWASANEDYMPSTEEQVVRLANLLDPGKEDLVCIMVGIIPTRLRHMLRRYPHVALSALVGKAEVMYGQRYTKSPPPPERDEFAAQLKAEQLNLV